MKEQTEENKRSQYSSMQIRPIDTSPHWNEDDKNIESVVNQDSGMKSQNQIANASRNTN